MKAQIVIIGASGNIGRALTKDLAKRYALKILVHRSASLNFQKNRFIKTVKGDFLKQSDLVKLISPGSTIINLVGGSSADENDHQKLLKLNLVGQNNLLEVCRDRKVKKIIFFSTINCYKPLARSNRESDPLLPTDFYSLTKSLSETIYEYFSRQYKIPAVIIRAGSVYGPDFNKGIIATFMKTIKKMREIHLPKTPIYRDFIFIDDLVAFINKTLTFKGRQFEIFNASSGQKTSLSSLAKKTKQVCNQTVKIRRLHSPPPLTATWADNSKSKRILGFIPYIKLEQGLKRVFKN